ncbi:MAG: hypothetical protein CFH06_01723 [Alphaproteobacteria bacterium MarineAlpha3_Bin5]|nr:hypothetical protein [Magnetovibrio sp.]PPR76505.1 MAG: hypothetical protein CFH06_01723 [Alphaproteobacteria bacterium MarineAlpha3_Bin5]
MNRKSIFSLAIGVSLLCFLIVWQGVEQVLTVISKGGWLLLFVCIFAPFDQFINAEAWRQLFPPSRRPSRIRVLLASWTGSSVNTLLPVISIGGEFVKARILILWSYAPEDAVSAMIVDKTVQAISVLLWALVGIVLLALVSEKEEIIIMALAGALVLTIGIIGFVCVQLKGGLGSLARLAARTQIGHKWVDLVESADLVDTATRAIYNHPVRIIGSVALRMIGRFLLVGEVLLATYLMGHPITFLDAVLLKGIVVGIRGVGFAIPGSYGVQEGGYMLVGSFIGLPPDLMIAVSLATRVREILPSIPFLYFWQHTEGRAFLKRH